MFPVIFLRFYANLIKYLKKNAIFVFHKLDRVNYVNSVGFTISSCCSIERLLH